DIERTLRADLLAERVLQREPNLTANFRIPSAVMYAQEVRRDHRLGARAGGRVVRRHERREVVGAREVVLIRVIAGLGLLHAQERAVAVAELAVLVAPYGRPDRLRRDARPVLLAVQEAAEKEVVPIDEPVERTLGRPRV